MYILPILSKVLSHNPRITHPIQPDYNPIYGGVPDSILSRKVRRHVGDDGWLRYPSIKL